MILVEQSANTFVRVPGVSPPGAGERRAPAN